MYWSKIIIASLAASPTFARRQRLGGPALLDNVEMVSEGKIFDNADVDQRHYGTVVSELDEDFEDNEPESVSSP